ncbi:MAG: TetR/AcrR family transcriptional regulator [Lachnospiraceae bacterium]|nr:TetR/AcrR family transcriptional regulator [Lachnospiraceae bacterium]MCI1327755.1 TetR/AcrR family transcriptional regulator [Lachnospiraceae bacterium]
MRRKDLDQSLIRGYITEAFLQLLKTKNYPDISVGEIAERAGVHRSTFYRHFGSKEEVLRGCLSRMLREAEGDRTRLRSDFASFIRPVFQAFYDNREQMLLLNRAGLSVQLLDALKDIFKFDEIPDTTGTDQDGDRGGAARVNTEKYRTAYRIGGIYSCLLLWFSHDMRETPEEMTRIATAL